MLRSFWSLYNVHGIASTSEGEGVPNSFPSHMHAWHVTLQYFVHIVFLRGYCRLDTLVIIIILILLYSWYYTTLTELFMSLELSCFYPCTFILTITLWTGSYSIPPPTRGSR